MSIVPEPQNGSITVLKCRTWERSAIAAARVSFIGAAVAVVGIVIFLVVRIKTTGGTRQDVVTIESKDGYWTLDLDHAGASQTNEGPAQVTVEHYRRHTPSDHYPVISKIHWNK